MKNAVKTIHILGFAMLLGGILGVIVSNLVTENNSNLIIITQQAQTIASLIRWLIIPGIITMVTSGLGMILMRKLNPLKLHWVAIKITIGVIAAVICNAFLSPLSNKMVSLASQNSLHGLIAPEYATFKGNEMLLGYTIIVLIVIITIVSVYKPIFKRDRH